MVEKSYPGTQSILIPVKDAQGAEWNLLAKKGRTKLRYEDDDYMVIGFGSLRALRRYRTEDNKRLPRDAYDVLFWLYEQLRQSNVVSDFKQVQIARDLGIDRFRVSHMLALLEQANCIQKIGSQCVWLNPLHAFWGNRIQQEESIAAWNRRKMTQQSERMQA